MSLAILLKKKGFHVPIGTLLNWLGGIPYTPQVIIIKFTLGIYCTLQVF